MAAQDFGQGDGSGYLSTDPYAGMDQGGGYGLPGGMGLFNGGVSGYGAPGAPSPTIQGPGAAQAGAYGGDPTNVDSWLQWMATQPGHDPILDTPDGQAYYRNAINSKPDKLNANNLSYWQNKATLASAGGAVGAPEGGSSGGPGGFGSGWNTLPTADQLKANPGFQYAIDEAQRGMESSAAAKGTLLNGRTNQAMSQNLANYALGNFYLPLANLGLNYNQANQDNLYRWGQLGLNGSSYGATGKPA